VGTFVVEGLEIEKFDARRSMGGVTDGLDDGLINSILVLGTGSVGIKENGILRGERSISLDNVFWQSMVSLLVVSVPVLSKHRMDQPFS
jgi:hypothetical protein